MEFIKPGINLDFYKVWNKALLISVIIATICLLFILYKIFVTKDFHWSTDFAGGTELQLQFDKSVDIGQVRSSLESGGFHEVSVVHFGDLGRNEFLVRLGETSKKNETISSRIVEALNRGVGSPVELLRVDEVGPKVGKDLKMDSILSLVLSILGISIYIWFRFTPAFAPGAVIALVHDAIIPLGVFAFLGMEFSLPIVAALLTIVGYSINDTIIIYDRIREKLKLARRGVLETVVNESLNETLSRTILTSSTVFFVLLALYAFGKGSIKDFAFVLLLGVVFGTYSSIFIATPVFVWVEKKGLFKLKS